jgi:hypothetical protein
MSQRNSNSTSQSSRDNKVISNSSTKLFSPRNNNSSNYIEQPAPILKPSVPTVLKPAPPPLPATLPPQTSLLLPKKTPLSPSSTSNVNTNSTSSSNSNNCINSPNESDKENDVASNNNNNNNKHGAENSSPALTNANGSNRVLSIKERKEFFSKKQPSNSTNSIYEKNNSSSSGLRTQKRLRSETGLLNESNNRNSDTHSKNSGIEFEPANSNSESSVMDNEQSVRLLNNGEIDFDREHDGEASGDDQMDGENGISANQIFSSAKQKQLDKEANAKTKTNVKLKTFYGGEEIKNMDDLKSMQKKTSSSSAKLNVSNNSVDYFNFEFIGAGVKLEKSILIVSTSNPGQSSQQSNGGNRSKKKKLERVNFTDAAETYEYPSYEFMLKEMGIDPSNDPDYQIVPLESENYGSNVADEDDARCLANSSSSSIINKPSYTQFLPGLIVNGGTGDSSSTDECDNDTKNESERNFTKLGMLYIFYKISNSENDK